MSIVAAILAALENPAVDAAILQAGAQLVAYFKGLPEQSRQAAIAQLEAAATSEHSLLAAFDADIVSTQQQLATLEAQHGSMAASIASVKASLVALARPLSS